MRVPQGPAPADPGRDGDPAQEPREPVPNPDPMSEAEWLAWCEATAGQDQPFDPEEWWDPQDPPAPGEDELTAAELAGIVDAVEGVAAAAAAGPRLGATGALAVLAASAGRRGPGQPGSAQVLPGESASRAAAFGTGLALDVAPGCPELAAFAHRAAGDDDAYQGASAALMGRELPPAEVLAADQRITAWARQLKKAGLEGSMDELRARAYLDLLLGKDSRPRPGPAPDDSGNGRRDGTDHPAGGGPGGSGPADSGPGGGSADPGTPGPGVIPSGFAGRITLTIPLATVAGLADRPGEMAGIGPIAPNLGANTPDRYQTVTRDARSRCWSSITKVTPCQPGPHG
jgi:hypothetical protein